jgi:hypothetical protein
MKHLVVAALVLVAFGAAVTSWWLSVDAGPGPVHLVDVEQRLPALANEPTTIEVVQRAEIEEDSGTQGVSEPGPLISSVNHLGRLEGAEYDFTATMLESVASTRKKGLVRFAERTGPTESEDLLREANLVLDDVEGECLVPALEAGLYLVEETPTLRSIDGARVVNMGCTKDGKHRVLTVVMPYTRFPRLKEAWDHREQMIWYHASEVARKFNALPTEHRKTLIAQRDSVLRNPKRSPADHKWLRTQFPARTRIDRRRLMLEAPVQ